MLENMNLFASPPSDFQNFEIFHQNITHLEKYELFRFSKSCKCFTIPSLYTESRKQSRIPSTLELLKKAWNFASTRRRAFATFKSKSSQLTVLTSKSLTPHTWLIFRNVKWARWLKVFPMEKFIDLMSFTRVEKLKFSTRQRHLWRIPLNRFVTEWNRCM